MYKLYTRKNTGAAAVEALLEMLSAPYQLIEVAKSPDAKAPEWYYDVNPRGEVPTLELPNGSVMTESAAIMIYLADTHQEAVMSPDLGTAERAQYLRWMIYLATTAYNSDLRMYYSERYSTDVTHAEAIKAKAIIDLARDFEVFVNELGEGPFILGDAISAADIYAAMILSWSNDVEGLFVRHPKLQRLYEAVVANRKVRKVWDRNDMQ
jgi:glutathione S-transferase